MPQPPLADISPEQLITLVKTSIRVKIEYQYHGITNHVYTISSYPFEVAQLLCASVSRIHGSWKSSDDMSAEDIEAASANVPQSITVDVRDYVPLWYGRMVFDWMLRYCESGRRQTETMLPDGASPKFSNFHHWRLLEAAAMIEVPLMSEALRSGIRRLQTQLSSREDVFACFDIFMGNHPARYSVLRRHTHVLLTNKDHGDRQAKLRATEEIRDVGSVAGVNRLENWVGVNDALPTDAQLREYSIAADTQSIQTIAGDSSVRQARTRVRLELSRIDSIQEASRNS